MSEEQWNALAETAYNKLREDLPQSHPKTWEELSPTKKQLNVDVVKSIIDMYLQLLRHHEDK